MSDDDWVVAFDWSYNMRPEFSRGQKVGAWNFIRLLSALIHGKQMFRRRE